MGKAYSLLMRPLRTFNIENRAARVISKEKPTPAPQYPSSEKQRKLVDELYPNFMETHYKKNVQLDERLKSVYVTSNDPEQKLKEEEQSVSDRPLPQIRENAPEFQYGFYEPIAVPEGKCTLGQAITFISKHKENDVEYSVENIALKYKMDKEVVENILKHFKVPRFLDKDEGLGSITMADREEKELR